MSEIVHIWSTRLEGGGWRATCGYTFSGDPPRNTQSRDDFGDATCLRCVKDVQYWSLFKARRNAQRAEDSTELLGKLQRRRLKAAKKKEKPHG